MHRRLSRPRSEAEGHNLGHNRADGGTRSLANIRLLGAVSGPFMVEDMQRLYEKVYGTRQVGAA